MANLRPELSIHMNIKNALLFLSILISFNTFSQIEIYSEQISLDSVVNSTSDEINAVLSPDGQYLYFTRKNHPENIGDSKDQGDIWVSEKNEKGDWTPAYNLKAVNNEQNNTVIGFLNSGRSLLLSSDNQLAIAHKNGGKWSTPKSFEVPYLSSKSKELNASISADGRHILFGIESFGNYGVEDIYISRLKPDGLWTSPKNLGSSINTQNQEITPFLAADNKTLFFASNGHDGAGSFDIFMSTRLDDTWQKWSTPINLGSKINTKGRERSFSFLLDDEFAYLSSTQNSDGYGDIKKVKIAPNITPIEVIADTAEVIDIVAEEKVIAISGSVIDKKSNQTIIGAEIYVTTEPTNKEFKTLTNSEGEFNLTVGEGNNYTVKVKAFRYLSAETVVTDAALLNNEQLAFSLEPVIEGNTVTLDHVLFEQGSPKLVEGSEKELNLVVEMMKYNPDISIFLSGHTDNQGKSSLNVELSEDRVQTVMRYLTAQGVDKKRIAGKGYGGTKPIASNASAETRKLNRRVEFTVHKIKD
ncbi:Outer membrane protein OmpA [Reichenbachiella faecimaris]|uniref:Outer membrane protein OmpA n=1 Tax=Reichenbachiella faecimaris TaxID=692418 RepID=A0A1W2GJN4_REIFA|nr:OmpA family protein [Reichenbachiella faecimaris]SMD36869.1 Outer membrane protein OmpA [Reichenbachiella faecimaris]